MSSAPAPPLILASASPRRSDLLRAAGYRFTVVKPEVVEIEDPAIPIRELTARNARLKADAVASAHPGAVTIGADTLVLLGDTVFGKPIDRAEAARMLAELSGRTHQVFTAVSFLHHEGEKKIVHSLTVATEVTFKTLGPDERSAYHAKIDPLDKAGAYAAQEEGGLIIERITGSRSNVVGLPMDEVAEALERHFGIRAETVLR
ncbi:MAG: septum formation protein Maf [Verrucomicrobiaceae bacterium]|nr:septum formation protein Maf [Verrucomicrobiaceae bacterium]